MRLLRALPLLLVPATLALVGGPIPARAGSVVGTVAIPPEAQSLYTAYHADMYVGHVMPGGMRQEAMPSDTTYGVAYIDEPPGGGEAPAAALLDQYHRRFVPRILAVVSGQSVEFRNTDDVYHNIFSYSPPKRFDLGRYPRGRSKLVSFRKLGAVQIYCDIHSDMRADLLVVPGPLFGYVNAQWQYRIENVPPGPHRLVVWFPSGGGERRTVTVEADAPAVGAATSP